MKVIFTRTNSAQTRIRATDGDGNTASAIRDSSRQFEEQHADAVRALCNKMGWKGTLIGGYVLKDGATIGRAWIFDDARALRITIDGPVERGALHVVPCPECGRPHIKKD